MLGIIRERGRRGLPLEDIYRQLYNPALYLRAYARLYANKGAMTPGSTSETADGTSLAKIDAIIAELRAERYRWTPVRRIYIPKKRGKKLRPLGMPVRSDKLLQEVLRLILEAYYEPQMSPRSHGFRPGLGCHTALQEIRQTWHGTKWFLEGDITGCFDNLSHEVLLSILREKLHDNRFLRLIENLLKAGYLEQWTYHATLSGCPQGGVVSPVLSNVYLDRLDRYVEQMLIPAYTRGIQRQRNKAYNCLRTRAQYYRKRGKWNTAAQLDEQRRHLPERDPNDPEYRRLRYIRYADDFCLGLAGPKQDAEAIKQDLQQFLRDSLKLELSEEKTLITHATTEPARFLGYEIIVQHQDTKHDHHGRRSVNGAVALRVPPAVIQEKPRRRAELLLESDFNIISRYQAEYRGFVQYYQLAQNVSWLWKVHRAMQLSLLKILAGKHQSSVGKMIRRYHTTITLPEGTYVCLQVQVERKGKQPLVARFGGIPLRRQTQAVLTHGPTSITRRPERNDLLKRLLADTCELCQSTEHIEVHHIRKLADLKQGGWNGKPLWARSWQHDDARPWSSVAPATMPFMRASQRNRVAERDHWRADYAETCTVSSEGGRGKRAAMCLASGLPYSSTPTRME